MFGLDYHGGFDRITKRYSEFTKAKLLQKNGGLP